MFLRSRRRWISCLLGAALLLLAGSAQADPHRSHEAAHPLRIVAYALHPVGWVLDRLIVRPAHWLAHRGPVGEVVGHHD